MHLHRAELLEQSARRHLRVHRDADAELLHVAALAPLRLVAPQLLVPRDARRLVEGFDVIRRVVVGAGDGRERELLGTQEVLLPKIDGRELTRTLKTNPNTASGKVVIITALYKGSRYRGEAIRDYLADEFMEKPVAADKLRQTIDRLLEPAAVAQ